MTLYPEVQRKAQAEIDQVVGNSRLPDFSDQDALPYVQAVLKEVLRWHPVTPLGVSLHVMIFMGDNKMITLTGGPHKVTVSDVYEGYYIPAGSIIIPNAWYAPLQLSFPRTFNHDDFQGNDARSCGVRGTRPVPSGTLAFPGCAGFPKSGVRVRSTTMSGSLPRPRKHVVEYCGNIGCI